MTIKIIEVLLPQMRTPGFVDTVDFQDLVIHNITIRHFEAAQNIVLKKGSVEHFQAKFQNEFAFQWTNEDTKMYKTLEIFSIFSQNDVKRMKDTWIAYSLPSNMEMPDQQETSINTIITSPNEASDMTSLNKLEFERVWKEAFLIASEDEESCNKALIEYLFDAFDSNKSGMVDFK